MVDTNMMGEKINELCNTGTIEELKKVKNCLIKAIRQWVDYSKQGIDNRSTYFYCVAMLQQEIKKRK
jgi:hypothetical protein